MLTRVAANTTSWSVTIPAARFITPTSSEAGLLAISGAAGVPDHEEDVDAFAAAAILITLSEGGQESR